jgi:hypothetical protein
MISEGLRSQNSLGRREIPGQDSPEDRIYPAWIFAESSQRFLQHVAAKREPGAYSCIAIAAVFHVYQALTGVPGRLISGPMEVIRSLISVWELRTPGRLLIW